MVILQLAVLFTFLAAGELIVWLTGVPVPSSIIGMLLLTLALRLGVVRLHHVEGVVVIAITGLIHQYSRKFMPHNGVSRK